MSEANKNVSAFPLADFGNSTYAHLVVEACRHQKERQQGGNQSAGVFARLRRIQIPKSVFAVVIGIGVIWSVIEVVRVLSERV